MDDELEARNLATVKAFVLRARRVIAHSIAQDTALLDKFQLPKIKVTFTPSTGDTTITVELPNEEQFESAAARVRPLILESEPTYHAKVMNSLLYFARKANMPDKGIAALRDLKKQWAAMNADDSSLGSYDVRQQQGDEEEVRITDRRLATAWVYGDVVHADEERRTESRRFGVEERFRAAVPFVVRLILLTMWTLRVIQVMKSKDSFPDLGDVFEEEVVVTRTVIETAAKAFVADHLPDGTVPEPVPVGESMGPGWKTFEEALPDLLAEFEAASKQDDTKADGDG